MPMVMMGAFASNRGRPMTTSSLGLHKWRDNAVQSVLFLSSSDERPYTTIRPGLREAYHGNKYMRLVSSCWRRYISNPRLFFKFQALAVRNKLREIVKMPLEEDLDEQFGRLQIDNKKRKTVTRQVPIVDVLKPSLSAVRELEVIADDHECFEPVRGVCDKWNIGDVPYSNFVKLLCGYLQFPLILLQNPSKLHTESFDSMRSCPTIGWISRKLDGMGLLLSEVPVLDICSLFSDHDLAKMSEHDQESAREDAYRMAENVLKILRLKLFSVASAKPRASLCSTVAEAKDRVATRVQVDDYSFWAVKGVHPMRVIYNPGEENVLNELFDDMYHFCASRKRLQRLICLAERLLATITLVSSSMRVAPSATENWLLRVENPGRLLDPTGELLAAIENFALSEQEDDLKDVFETHEITPQDTFLRFA
ncbi:hypothetical protein PCL_07385 [Purpureocillium lilacinum]|uniref:Uncharacterized protein n=1 Tax=Purpureocillium lilacinum TaxID=33203 RepID=A0A2U3DS56_PURLI|nr:hypothetical protein PCL_07385 [Purpureocillium lilacinum]